MALWVRQAAWGRSFPRKELRVQGPLWVGLLYVGEAGMV